MNIKQAVHIHPAADVHEAYLEVVPCAELLMMHENLANTTSESRTSAEIKVSPNLPPALL
jgi:hypothetical protein